MTVDAFIITDTNCLSAKARQSLACVGEAGADSLDMEKVAVWLSPGGGISLVNHTPLHTLHHLILKHMYVRARITRESP